MYSSLVVLSSPLLVTSMYIVRHNVVGINRGLVGSCHCLWFWKWRQHSHCAGWDCISALLDRSSLTPTSPLPLVFSGCSESSNLTRFPMSSIINDIWAEYSLTAADEAHTGRPPPGVAAFIEHHEASRETWLNSGLLRRLFPSL